MPGLFLIGAASGRDLIKLGMNQGYEVIEHLMGREVEPADEAVLKERLPFWEGTVRERIAVAPQHAIPLLAAADEQQLRETFLAARVREYANGETIIRQNDYTNDFLIIAGGRVELLRKPENNAAETKIAELTAGNFFGEMSLISGRRRTATARAVGPTRIIEIPRKAILKLLGRRAAREGSRRSGLHAPRVRRLSFPRRSRSAARASSSTARSSRARQGRGGFQARRSRRTRSI